MRASSNIPSTLATASFARVPFFIWKKTLTWGFFAIKIHQPFEPSRHSLPLLIPERVSLFFRHTGGFLARRTLLVDSCDYFRYSRKCTLHPEITKNLISSKSMFSFFTQFRKLHFFVFSSFASSSLSQSFPVEIQKHGFLRQQRLPYSSKLVRKHHKVVYRQLYTILLAVSN